MSTRPEAGAHGLVLELQAQLDRFADYYNTVRPNRALTRRTRLEAFRARTKAVPRNRPVVVEGHHRVRRDRIVKTGRSPSVIAASSSTSASAERMPARESCCSCMTSTLELSTTRPESSSAPSPSTPPRTTSPSASRPAPNPPHGHPIEGSGVSDVSRHHMAPLIGQLSNSEFNEGPVRIIRFLCGSLKGRDL